MRGKNILFVCRYNRFRSRIAEAYFKKINKNKSLRVKSAGAIKGSPVDKIQTKVAKKFSLNIKGTPKALSTKLLKWLDISIIVANDVPLNLFKHNKKLGKKIIIWKIKDVKETDEKAVKRTIKIIMKKIDKLVKKLN